MGSVTRLAIDWTESGMDSRKEQIMTIFGSVYGDAHGAQWFQRWRIFFMACAELFGHNEGREWFVSHYLCQRQSIARLAAVAHSRDAGGEQE